MLATFHLLWNALVPWRRRRRYYFLRVLPRVAALHQDPDHPTKPISETLLAHSVGMPLSEFSDVVAGRAVPSALIETVGRMAYKIAAPDWWTVYGPAVLLAVAVALALAVLFVR